MNMMFLLLFICMIMFSGCAKAENISSEAYITSEYVTASHTELTAANTSSATEYIANAQPPYVNIDGSLYWWTSDIVSDEDINMYISDEFLIGQIKYDVDLSELPSEDMTSNVNLKGMSVYRKSESVIIVQIPEDRPIKNTNGYSYCYLDEG